MLAGGLEWADPTDLDGLREALELADPEGRLAPVGMSRVEIGREALYLLPEVVSELTRGPRAVLDLLGVPARDTLLVGDRLATDMRVANESGMAGALVLTGATTLDEALGSGDRPEYVIQNLGDLLPGQG